MDNIKRKQYEYGNEIDKINPFIAEKNCNVFILGHSCGISDREILNEIFTHYAVDSISAFYYNRKGYGDVSKNIDRIIDNHSNGDNKKIFQKFLKYNESIKMLQYNSSKNDEIKFREGTKQLVSSSHPSIKLREERGYDFVTMS